MDWIGPVLAFARLPDLTKTEIRDRLIDDDGYPLISIDEVDSVRSFTTNNLVFAVDRSAIYADFDRFFVAGFLVDTTDGGSERVVLADSYPETQYTDIAPDDQEGLQMYLTETSNSLSMHLNTEEVTFILKALKQDNLTNRRELFKLWATLRFPTLTGRMYQSIVSLG